MCTRQFAVITGLRRARDEDAFLADERLGASLRVTASAAELVWV